MGEERGGSGKDRQGGIGEGWKRRTGAVWARRRWGPRSPGRIVGGRKGFEAFKMPFEVHVLLEGAPDSPGRIRGWVGEASERLSRILFRRHLLR